MAFDLSHPILSQNLQLTPQLEGGKTFFRISETGRFQVLYPGKIRRKAEARFTQQVQAGNTPMPRMIGAPVGGHTIGGINVDVDTRPISGGTLPFPPRGNTPPMSTSHFISLKFQIFTPDGEEFTQDSVSLDELADYRDLRGLPAGAWTYLITGESKRFDSNHSTLSGEYGYISLTVIERVISSSAPSVLSGEPVPAQGKSFSFDLYRIGQFRARLITLPGTSAGRGTMRLLDPNGKVVARTRSKLLEYDVSLRDIDLSRSISGKIRKWKLVASARKGNITTEPRLVANVFESSVIRTTTIQSRIDTLLGSHGENVEIYCENKANEILVRLIIKSEVLAETIDMHGLLDNILGSVQQDPNVDTRTIEKDVPYVLYRRPDHTDWWKFTIGYETKGVKVHNIDFSVGPGVKLDNSFSIRLKLKVKGKLEISVFGIHVGEAKIRNNLLEVEMGLTIGPDMNPKLSVWTSDEPIDIDLSMMAWASIIALSGVSFFSLVIGGGATALFEYIERTLNNRVKDIASVLTSNRLAPYRFLMTLHGGHFDYLPIRTSGSDSVIEYVAPFEHEPLPDKHYRGVIGREIKQAGGVKVIFHPSRIGNTWEASNLSKIDHIVVVMMENRSFDHVLGYRAQPHPQPGESTNGLTPRIVNAIEAAGTQGMCRVRPLSSAGFASNSLNLKTRIPKAIGHDLEDVKEQLGSGTVPDGNGGVITNPNGFVNNFSQKLGSDAKGVVPSDVLGYYTAQDLPVYGFLADHFSYCDNYFSSHPGPTLPNRMYSLTGDIQYDRFGVPILDNNNGDNFLLSRATTIYDVLSRKGVDWRVYESAPSITMLRMFARYATDNTHISHIDKLRSDILNDNLPSFTAIEPAMHHKPANDDHPDADMYRGQRFIWRVYSALRSNPRIWNKTLLIVTYDEHGGLYDHASPPVADWMSKGQYAAFPGAAAATRATRHPNRRTSGQGTAGHGYSVLGRRAVSGSLTAISTAHGSTNNQQPNADELRIPYGVRVPTFLISPWVPNGPGPSITLDHCSILKTVLARFCGSDKPFLSDRVHASHSFNNFLTENAPRTNIPTMPEPSPLPVGFRSSSFKGTSIATPILMRNDMRQGSVDYHQLSGRLARMLGR